MSIADVKLAVLAGAHPSDLFKHFQGVQSVQGRFSSGSEDAVAVWSDLFEYLFCVFC